MHWDNIQSHCASDLAGHLEQGRIFDASRDIYHLPSVTEIGLLYGSTNGCRVISPNSFIVCASQRQKICQIKDAKCTVRQVLCQVNWAINMLPWVWIIVALKSVDECVGYILVHHGECQYINMLSLCLYTDGRGAWLLQISRHRQRIKKILCRHCVGHAAVW